MARRLRIFSPPAFQPQLSRDQRRATGAYYTPPEIVRQMVELALGPLLEATSPHRSPPRAKTAPVILDPACGAGEFLLQALRWLRARYSPQAMRHSVLGIDIDPAAVAAARSRLTEVEPTFAAENIQVGDALAPDRLAPASLDVIVGNPPYINIRQLAKTLPPGRIDALRGQYCTARGNFDLYVIFIERAIELLRPGGRCAFIVPGKWATLDYARPCRELLLSQTTIEHVIDYSEARAFAETSVYPHVLVFRKEPAATNHVIHFQDFQGGTHERIEQRLLSADAIHLGSPLAVESRIPTRPLGEIATLSCGTAGYSAQRIARRLLDCTEALAGTPTLADFITTGNIDRYVIHRGNVRYLNQHYARPRLPLDIPELSSAKRRLFSSPKIVIAGISRRLEAAWDTRGLALGVQVFAASDFHLDPFYLLALLNSKLLSYLFATRYAAKRLGGGYLAINKGQLARLPIRVLTAGEQTDRRVHDCLRELAARWESSSDAQIDRLVYQLYRLTAAEIARVEAHFSTLVSRAA